MRLVRVAVPVPALDSLTYTVPDDFPDPSPGARALVPLGSRVLTGVITAVEQGPASGGQGPGELGTGTAAPELKAVIDLLDAEAFLPPDVVRLAAWTAEYYACGMGEAMAAAMPPRAWIESERHAAITGRGMAALAVGPGSDRGQTTSARWALLERLADGKPLRVDTLSNGSRGTRAALVTLERDGLVSLTSPLRGTATAFRTVRTAALTAQGMEIATIDPADASAPRLGGRQREALSVLAGAPDGLDTPELSARGVGAQTLTRLAALGLVSIGRRRIERDPFAAGPALTIAAVNLVLTPDQQRAFDALHALADGGTFKAGLLHGVTGSGKTEIYLRLADVVRRAGRRVLLLVPEIALTPAVAARVRATFGDRVAIQHSGLSDGERHDQWHRIRRGDVDVVVGTRSAVFAPLADLGLIVVDEEHDGSYKQEESPRYNGRDVAVVRAQQAGACIVLGSATPSMESYQNALAGRYALVRLERRVLDRPLADVRVVDMREEYAAAGPDVILSTVLRESLEARLARREQAIVLLNRRGFANAVFCRQCGATLECPNCSVSLTVHRAAHRARCHYCNYSMRLPKACTACAGPYLEQMGFGTERVEAEIAAAFPAARVARVDRDTMRRRGAIAALLARFGGGEIDVLVGTQMIAKGHDFPRVTLVGVVSADIGLGFADFRASERTFQLLTQVAGRAGRGEARGEAIVQTIFPNHYSIQHACRQDYEAFFAQELEYRRTMRYPPAVSLINTIVKGRTRQGAMQDAAELVERLRSAGPFDSAQGRPFNSAQGRPFDSAQGRPYRVLGPAPAPLSRLKGEHRAQFFLKGTHRGAMRRALLAVLESRPEIRRRTIVDVDPMSVL